jgi:hypothetical protein
MYVPVQPLVALGQNHWEAGFEVCALVFVVRKPWSGRS